MNTNIPKKRTLDKGCPLSLTGHALLLLVSMPLGFFAAYYLIVGIGGEVGGYIAAGVALIISYLFKGK